MRLAAARINVSGRVQGVGFRYFVYQSARRRGLTGTVRNMVDGKVEVFVQGERALIDDFLIDLKIGPPAARVDQLDIGWLDQFEKTEEFQII